MSLKSRVSRSTGATFCSKNRFGFWEVTKRRLSWAKASRPRSPSRLSALNFFVFLTRKPMKGCEVHSLFFLVFSAVRVARVALLYEPGIGTRPDGAVAEFGSRTYCRSGQSIRYAGQSA